MSYQELNMMLKDMDRIPFPRLEDVKADSTFGRMLYNSYGGPGGELTAITQYVYEHITNEEKEEVGKVMMAVAIQEMRHLDVLGGLLKKFDLVPYYMGSRNNKWCSDNVKYHFNNIPEMMRHNIGSEEEAIREYKRLIEATDNNSIRGILARIIMDEENHIKVFKELEKEFSKPKDEKIK